MNLEKLFGLTMKTLFFGVVTFVALSSAFEVSMRTKGISYSVNVHWILENLNELPYEFESKIIQSSANDDDRSYTKFILSLKIDKHNNVLKIYLYAISRTTFNINGTVNFKNSMNHIFGERVIYEEPFYFNQKSLIVDADILHLFGKDTFADVFDMLNNTLAMDFSMKIAKYENY